ncbi:GP63-like [Trichomonas vaginalis G3]|uniref:GP63-like n=1 Tax=Trichomonas vaginalis (strain ATCC PRA-98 / G3) TaxID=412133 RepID=A2DFL2_TRIV3|nr:regulation of choline O-acetyltransferase protein [Trichomonas vaginalis G3]EAY20715.1 GP63-like [Trichomonas vaginalis G3]KAI5528728.1 regulation of choline O-acetyltransferase protein [Trichomonas vaginalis G3]|eukprot:XP_001581701.1 GP63-like [Trichomonas vaginalis G3]
MILLPFFAYLLHAHGKHPCGHSMLKLKPILPPISNKTHKVAAEDYPFKPIRIQIDYGYIDGTKNDPLRCTSVGQEITWNGFTYICLQYDVLNASTRTAIHETLDNVKAYAEKLLGVQQTVNEFTLVNMDGSLPIDDTEVIKNIDMHFTVFVRPFGEGSAVLAAAAPLNATEDFYRPIQGVIYINAVQFGEASSNYDSWDNGNFYILFHEMTHAFGMTPILYRHFHPENSNIPYETYGCQLTRDGKQFTYLTTPQAHIYAKKHFGEEYFYGDNGEKCPSGIELENGPGAGTAMSHPEARVYLSDYMVGETIQTGPFPFNRVTDVSMSFLIDSGNYHINYSMIQPILWGNGESIDGNPIKGFATEPPVYSFPSYYLYNDTYGSLSGFDFKFFGRAAATKRVSCPPSKERFAEYCNGIEFYNPTNSRIIGYDYIYDYVPTVFPTYVCPKGTAILPDMLSCGSFTCNKDFTEFTIDAVPKDDENERQTLTCKEGDENKSTTFNIKYKGQLHNVKMGCISPNRFCRSTTMHDMTFTTDPFDENTDLGLPNSQKQNSSFPKWAIAVIVIVVILLIIVIIGAVWYVLRSRRNTDLIAP